MKIVSLNYHSKMKFPTEHEVEEVKEDDDMFRECYIDTLKGSGSKEALIVERLEARDENELQRGNPMKGQV
ncbi:hypothetical protein FCV25MIE_34362 [Fagus crenata]